MKYNFLIKPVVYIAAIIISNYILKNIKKEDVCKCHEKCEIMSKKENQKLINKKIIQHKK